MVDETDIASYQKLLQRQRVRIFLAGLEGDFKQVSGKILRKDLIPELEECYALVRREDVRRGVMNGQLENSEASAMVTRNRSNQNWSPQHQQDQKRPIHPKTANGGDKSSYKCTHCDQTGYTKSRCYELVGYPGGIIVVIPGRRIPRRPLLLQLLKQRQRIIAVKSPRHWQQQQVMVVRF